MWWQRKRWQRAFCGVGIEKKKEMKKRCCCCSCCWGRGFGNEGRWRTWGQVWGNGIYWDAELQASLTPLWPAVSPSVTLTMTSPFPFPFWNTNFREDRVPKNRESLFIAIWWSNQRKTKREAQKFLALYVFWPFLWQKGKKKALRCLCLPLGIKHNRTITCKKRSFHWSLNFHIFILGFTFTHLIHTKKGGVYFSSYGLYKEGLILHTVQSLEVRIWDACASSPLLHIFTSPY